MLIIDVKDGNIERVLKSYKNKVKSGSNLVDYMSQVNHPNEKGHQMITDEIMGYFK